MPSVERRIEFAYHRLKSRAPSIAVDSRDQLAAKLEDCITHHMSAAHVIFQPSELLALRFNVMTKRLAYAMCSGPCTPSIT